MTPQELSNARSAPEEWTALDSLHAIAHHGDRDIRSATIFSHRELVSKASDLSTAQTVASSASAAGMNARAEVVSSNKKIAKAKFRKASAAHHHKHFVQRRPPASIRVAADNHPAPVFFGFPILQ